MSNNIFINSTNLEYLIGILLIFLNNGAFFFSDGDLRFTDIIDDNTRDLIEPFLDKNSIKIKKLNLITDA